MDELSISRIEKENKGKPIETVFPNFFDNLPDNVKYLDNLDYLKKVRVDISPNQITMYNDSNEKIGDVEFLVNDKPFRHVYIRCIDVEKKFSGKKYGSMLVEILNAFLRKKDIVGILQNGVDIVNDARNIQIKQMDSRFYSCLFFYKNHGWQALTTVNDVPNYMIYNFNNKNIDELKKMYHD